MRDTLVALLLLATAGAAPFEMPRSRAVKDVLPAEIVTGPHYRIDERVRADGIMHHFTVRSDYGTFDVTGELPLRRLLDEIKAITSLRAARNLATAGEWRRLRSLNETKLKTAGIAMPLRRQFLDHPQFSPTHETIMVEAILGLAAVSGRSAFLEAAVTAQDEAHALFYVTASQILNGYHRSVAPLREIHAVTQRLFVGRSATGAGIVPLPADHLLWTERVDDLVRTVKAAYRTEGFTGRFEVWTPGRVSARAHAELAQRGFAAVERLGLRIQILY